VRATSDLCGRVLDARYRLDRVVATGGMGTVYEGFDARLERTVAVKVMNDDLLYEPGFTERFATEARAAARLSDRHAVAVFDRGRSADAVYLVMEYVPGRTLREELKWGGRLPVARTLDVLAAVLQALVAAHAAGFVHGDIKPENVLLGERGEIKVTDFGLARAIGDADHKASLLMGTAAYLAPEQATDRTPDPRSDLYSAGILLFEMLTGHVPFRADSADDVLALHRTHTVPLPSTFVEIGGDIDDLCARATARNPSERFANAAEMLATVIRLRYSVDTTAPLPPRRKAAPKVPDPSSRDQTRAVPTVMVAPTVAAVAIVGEDADPGPRTPEVAVDPSTTGPAVPPASAPFRPRRRRGVGLLLVVALVGLVGYAAWQFGFTETVNTPKLAGMTRSQALAALNDAGLTMRVVEEKYSERRKAGTIIRSDPRGGERIAANGTVDVVMSKGPERFRVPDMRGMSQQAAGDALKSVTLRPGDAIPRYSRAVPAGSVLGTDPPEGTALRRGTEVALLVSQGPRPVAVPDVRGMTVDQANQTLADSGLKPRVQQTYDEDIEFGRAVGTEPAGGATVYRGDRVTVIVSKGSQYVSVPSVVGMETEAARRILQDAGFEVTTREQFGVTVADRVISQDPSGGSRALPGALVTLTIT
jgi:serine/threonine-protein kinase